MKIKAGFGNKKLNIEAKKLSTLGCYLGLMFKSRNSENLLFDIPGKWGIHSFFVFFPFVAIWLDEKNRVIDKKIVKPFTFYENPCRRFAKLIEIPVNERNKRIISVLSSVRGKV